MKIGRIILQPAPGQETRQTTLDTEIEKVIEKTFDDPIEFICREVPNELAAISQALIQLCDQKKCLLVFTTGNLGPGLKEITPDATRAVLDRELPGFGEIMRYYAYERHKSALLSRATAGIRGKAIIINLPTYPKAVAFCLRLLREGLPDVVEQVSGFRPTLKIPEIEVPLEKWFPFLKHLRSKNPPFARELPSQEYLE